MSDLNKLPKWAKYRIEKLEADLGDYKQQIAYVEGESETDTFIGLSEPRPLPKGESIYFYIGNRIDYKFLSVRVDGDHIDLNASDSIVIQPRATNSAWVGFSRLG